MNFVSSVLARVWMLTALAVGTACAVWSLWSTWIAFAGGKLPFLPIHFTGASLLRGLAWLLVGDPIALGILGVASSVALMPLTALSNRAIATAFTAGGGSAAVTTNSVEGYTAPAVAASSPRPITAKRRR